MVMIWAYYTALTNFLCIQYKQWLPVAVNLSCVLRDVWILHARIVILVFIFTLHNLVH